MGTLGGRDKPNEKAVYIKLCYLIFYFIWFMKAVESYICDVNFKI